MVAQRLSLTTHQAGGIRAGAICLLRRPSEECGSIRGSEGCRLYRDRETASRRRSEAFHSQAQQLLANTRAGRLPNTRSAVPRLFTMDPKTISVGRRTSRQQIVNSVAHEPPGACHLQRKPRRNQRNHTVDRLSRGQRHPAVVV